MKCKSCGTKDSALLHVGDIQLCATCIRRIEEGELEVEEYE